MAGLATQVAGGDVRAVSQFLHGGARLAGERTSIQELATAARRDSDVLGQGLWDLRHRLAAVEGELRAAYFRSLIGRNLRVLVESRSSATAGHAVGTSCRYAPVELPGGAMVGQLVNAVAREVIPGPRIGALPI